MNLKKYLIAMAAMGLASGSVWANVADSELGQQNKEAAEQFDQLDANSDGVLSQEEVAGSPDLANADPGAIDSNGDQQISFSEFVEHQNGSAGDAQSSMEGESDTTS